MNHTIYASDICLKLKAFKIYIQMKVMLFENSKYSNSYNRKNKDFKFEEKFGIQRNTYRLCASFGLI